MFRYGLPLLFVIGLLCFMVGCSKPRTVKVVETVEVPVEIPVKREVPAELMKCWPKDKPGFKFYAPLGEDDGAVLRRYDWESFKQWVERKNRCLEAWNEFHKETE